MPTNPSLAEYLAQANRTNNFMGVFGPDFMQKQVYMGVDTTSASISGDIFTRTFGRKIWHALNNQTRFFNAIPRVVWGNTAGWRVRTDRGSGRSRPVTEAGTLPTIDVSDIATVSSLPRIVASTFGVTVQASFIAQLEGGAGDIMGMEMENAQIDHIKEINEELLAGSGSLISAGTTTTFDVPAAFASHFKIGDTVQIHDETGGAFQTGGAVTVNPGTGTVTIGTAFGGAVNADDGDVVFMVDRAGFTSIDDIVQEDFAAAANTGMGGSASRVRAYDLTIGGRTAGTWNAGANVDWNAGVTRPLTLNLLDNVIRDIRVNGGDPKLIVLGHDQYYRLERLLQTQQRYLGYEEYQVGVGSEKTFPGTRGGMMLATYQGIPILPDADTPASVSTADAVLGSNIYILDTDYMEIAIALPTQYIENRDFFAANALVVRGLFYTLGELRVRNIWVQGVIRDLTA